MKRLVFAVSVAAALALPTLANAANHYVRIGATGNGSGSDWTNAYTTLPANLVRGDTYYLAAGNYGKHVFQDADSGTQTISIVRATSFNHGTDTGWSSTYNTGAAVFSNWQIYTDYYVFDGQRRNSDWNLGSTSLYGMRVSGSSPVRLDNASGKGTNHTTFRYVDFVGGGRDTGYNDSVIYGLTGNSYMTWEYCSLHDSDLTIFFMRGNWQNMVVDHSYIARNTSTPTMHGEMVSMTDSTNVTWSNNVMEDIEGTAFIADLNGGTSANWSVFGNVALHTAAYIADTGRKPGHNYGVSGFIFVAHDSSNNNYGNHWQVYNNSIVNIVGTYSGVVIQAGSYNTVRNNIWYGSVRTASTLGSNWAMSHNWYFNTSQDSDKDPSTITCTTNCSIFVNVAAKDFHLVAPVTAGYALSSPESVDLDGVTRAVNGNWDRGAYQFKGATLSSVTAPSGLYAH